MDQTLNDVLSSVIEKSKTQNRIMPAWVANEAYQTIDSESLAPTLVKIAALLALKQMARQLLRGKFEPDDDANKEQHEFWPNLQERYPIAHNNGDEPVYALLEILTEEDWRWNLNRLGKEADSKLKHRRALEEWGFIHFSRRAEA